MKGIVAPSDSQEDQPVAKKSHQPQSNSIKLSSANTNSNASFEAFKDKQRGSFAYLHDLTAIQVKQQLRGLGQPVTIFGEKTDERRERLFEVLLRKGERGVDTETHTHTQSHTASTSSKTHLEVAASAGIQTRGEQGNEDGADELNGDGVCNGSSDDEDVDRSHTHTLADAQPDTHTRAQHQHPKLTIKITGYDPSIMYSEMPQLKDQPCLVIYCFFKALLKQWQQDIQHQDMLLHHQAKRTTQQKLELRNFNLCKEHIQPLFQLCKSQQLGFDVQEKIFNMVRFCEQGDFRSAHDEYIKTAIGNSAWPIGLTMVRTGDGDGV